MAYGFLLVSLNKYAYHLYHVKQYIQVASNTYYWLNYLALYNYAYFVHEYNISLVSILCFAYIYDDNTYEVAQFYIKISKILSIWKYEFLYLLSSYTDRNNRITW